MGPVLDRGRCFSVAPCFGRGSIHAMLRMASPGGCGLRGHPPPRDAVHLVLLLRRCLSGSLCWVLPSRTRTGPRNFAAVPTRDLFFHTEVPDVVLDDVILPTVRFTAWLFSWFRVFQQGNIQIYLLYIFLALVALLLWR